MMIAIGLAAVAQPLHSRRQVAIVGRDRAPITKRAEVLGRVKAIGGRRPETPDWLPGAGREMSLTAVFDDRQVVTGCDIGDRDHVGGLSVQMNRHDSRGSRRNRCRDCPRVDGQAVPVDVCKHGRAPAIMMASAE